MRRHTGAERRRVSRATAAWTIAVAVGLLLTGCADDSKGAGAAGSAPAGEASAPPDQDTARLAYARCMTEHGVRVDAAQGVGPQAIQRQHDGQLDQMKFQAADAACNSVLRDAFGEPGQGGNPKADALLSFARCMREHGVQVPDPRPGSGGQGQLSMPKGPKVEEAQRDCQHLLPGVVSGTGKPQ
jgi:hypothetical protein